MNGDFTESTKLVELFDDGSYRPVGNTEINNPLKPNRQLSRTPPRTRETLAVGTPLRNPKLEPTILKVIKETEEQSETDEEISVAPADYSVDLFNTPPALTGEEKTLTAEIKEKLERQDETPKTHPIPIIDDSKENARKMNTTLAEAVDSGRSPMVPKFVSPEIFVPGRTDSVAFMNNYERCALSNGWDNAYKLNYLRSFLEGCASDWIMEYANKAENATKRWDEVKADFIREFGGEDTKKLAKIKFNTRRQIENEDVLTYYYDLRHLATQVNEKMDFNNFLEHFEGGLQNSLKGIYQMLYKKEMTKEELKAIVEKMSAVQKSILPPMFQNLSCAVGENNPRPTTISHQPTSSITPFNEKYKPRYYETANNHSNNESKQWNYTQQNFRNQKRGSGTSRSRTADGRVICWLCGNQGHYMASCRQNVGQSQKHKHVHFSNTRRKSPNGQGRHNQ